MKDRGKEREIRERREMIIFFIIYFYHYSPFIYIYIYINIFGKFCQKKKKKDVKLLEPIETS